MLFCTFALVYHWIAEDSTLFCYYAIFIKSLGATQHNSTAMDIFAERGDIVLNYSIAVD